jgi:hypothetical protein
MDPLRWVQLFDGGCTPSGMVHILIGAHALVNGIGAHLAGKRIWCTLGAQAGMNFGALGGLSPPPAKRFVHRPFHFCAPD